MTLRRILSLSLALAAMAGVFGQFALNGDKPGLEPWLPRAWDLLRYFTIWTNLLVAVLMLAEASGRRVGLGWLGTAALNIAMVGLVYQILLAPEVPLQRASWLTDFLMHAFVPVAMVLWWLAYAPRSVQLADIPYWLIWPVFYCIVAMLRGLAENRYPYFFLDVAKFGAGQVTLNIAGLVIVFALFGTLLWGAARIVERRR